MTSLLCNKPITKYISNPPPPSLSTHSRTHSHSPNQFPTYETQPTKIHVQQIPQIANPMKPTNRKYRETHKSQLHQFANTQIDSPQNHQDSITSTRETQFTKIETQLHHTQLNTDSKMAFKGDFDHHYHEGILGASSVLHKRTREAKGRIGSNELDTSVSAQEDLCPKQINTPLFWPLNSVKKVKPTLPQGRSTTLIEMMQFVSDWFDFEKGENDCCDELGDGVVDCVNSVQEKVVDCFDMVKNEEENDKNEKDLIKYEVGVYKSEEIVVSKSERDNEIIEANKNEEDGRPLCDCGEIVVDESTEVVLKSGNSVQGQLVDCFEVVKNVGENVKNVEEDDKIVFSIIGIFTRPMVEAIDLGDASSVVHQIVGTLCMGFENVKTKRARRCQWQIAWAISAFRWTIVSVPLWIWDKLRREFSVGVYHSHKSNMELRSIVVQLVHFRVLQPNSRSSSF